MIYRFENFEFDTYRMELRRDGEVIAIEPQVFSLLELLITAHDRVVSKDEINEIVWGGRFVSESALSSRVKLARKALNDNGNDQRLIKTVHNRGFRFLGEPETVEVIPGAAKTELPAAAQQTLYNPAHAEPFTPPQPGAADQGSHYVRDRPTIAVLPFEQLGGELEVRGFAKAISHELIQELSRLRWLYVIARGSSFRFDGANYDPEVIRKSLGADYILTGAVDIMGNESFINVELYGAEDGRIIWADRYKERSDELIGVRQTLAAQVVSAIEVRVPMEEAARAATFATENLGAWAAYHRGLSHMYRFNSHDNAVAAALFKRAVEADPNFARAYAGLSFTHFQNSFLNFVPDTREERMLAHRTAEKGFEIDSLDPFTNLTMGRASMLQGNVETAQHWFERSIALSPNYAFAKYNLAFVNMLCDNADSCNENVGSALLLSPLDPLKYAMLCARGMAHMAIGEYTDASYYCTQGALEPNAHIHIHAMAAVTNHLAGNAAAASAWAEIVKKRKLGNYQELFFRGFPLREEKTRRIVQKALKELGF